MHDTIIHSHEKSQTKLAYFSVACCLVVCGSNGGLLSVAVEVAVRPAVGHVTGGDGHVTVAVGHVTGGRWSCDGGSGSCDRER